LLAFRRLKENSDVHAYFIRPSAHRFGLLRDTSLPASIRSSEQANEQNYLSCFVYFAHSGWRPPAHRSGGFFKKRNDANLALVRKKTHSPIGNFICLTFCHFFAKMYFITKNG
jgi:hypothetical protein